MKVPLRILDRENAAVDKPDISTIRDADKRVIEARKRLEEANKSGPLFSAKLAAIIDLAEVKEQVEEQILDLIERFTKSKPVSNLLKNKSAEKSRQNVLV